MKLVGLIGYEEIVRFESRITWNSFNSGQYLLSRSDSPELGEKRIQWRSTLDDDLVMFMYSISKKHTLFDQFKQSSPQFYNERNINSKFLSIIIFVIEKQIIKVKGSNQNYNTSLSLSLVFPLLFIFVDLLCTWNELAIISLIHPTIPQSISKILLYRDWVIWVVSTNKKSNDFFLNGN